MMRQMDVETMQDPQRYQLAVCCRACTSAERTSVRQTQSQFLLIGRHQRSKERCRGFACYSRSGASVATIR
jgi:hypothetical protein